MPEPVPPLLVVDTNLIYTDPSLKNAAWTALQEAIKAREVDAAVPEVVLRESARHIQIRAKNARKAIQGAVEQISHHLADARLDPTTLSSLPSKRSLRSLAEISTDEARAELRSRLSELGCTVLAIPDTTNDKLVDWSLDQHRPFDETDKGYRDALIWFTVVEAALANRQRFVVYATNDNDCLKKDSAVLHDDLAAHLEELQLVLTVGFARSIQDALAVAQNAMRDRRWLYAGEWELAPEVPITSAVPTIPLAQLRDLLSERAWEKVSDELIGAPLVRDLPDGGHEYLVEGISLPPHLEGATVSDVERKDPFIVSTEDTKVGRIVTGTARVIIGIDYEGFLPKAEYVRALSENQNQGEVSIVDPNWSDRMVAVSSSYRIMVSVDLSFVINPEVREVVALDISDMRVCYPTYVMQ